MYKGEEMEDIKIMERLETLNRLAGSVNSLANAQMAMLERMSGLELSVHTIMDRLEKLQETPTPAAPEPVETQEERPRKRRPYNYTKLSKEEFEKAKAIVRGIAKDKPLRPLIGSVAVDKDDVYQALASGGCIPHVSVRDLAKANVIRTGRNSHNGIPQNSYTPTVRIDGKVKRVIIYNGIPGEVEA